MAVLKGKKALVTGGSRGIGRAIAERLAADGARVAITYVRSDDEAARVVSGIAVQGGEAMAIQADNRDAAAVQAAVAQVVSHFGGIDILVNNAGIIQFIPIDQLTLVEYDKTLDINVRAVFVATHAAVPHISDGGRIITIGSNLAHRVQGPGLSLYAMSKAALIGFTKGLARDLGHRNITANIVHPGPTDTDMNPATGDMAERRRSRMAIPRYNDPVDVAGLVAWLAGPEGRSMTGTELTIDAGTNA